MPAILLFGATGYTGKLTAAALHERGADFAIAGRNRAKLEALAAQVGDPPIHVVSADDVDGLVAALDGMKVIVSCVGPFVEYGDAAAEAAVRAGVHYIDSTGEGTFIDRLMSDYGPRAESAGIAMAPAMGFDEVPGDVAVARACGGLSRPHVTVTYAVPRTASAGTIRSALGIMGSTGPFLIEGEEHDLRAGQHERWSPMPPPLGPRRAICFPLALLRLAPLHEDMSSFGTFVTTGEPERLALKLGGPLLGLTSSAPVGKLLDALVARLPEGPDEQARSGGRWTVLVEARSDDGWRNVVATGTDVYGLTATTLSAAAVHMSQPDYEGAGVIAPVQAAGIETLEAALAECGVKFDTYAPV